MTYPYQSYEEEKQEALYQESLPYNPGIDARREAQYFGFKREDAQWLLTAYDEWVLNPYYDGPDQGHPEDEYPPEPPVVRPKHIPMTAEEEADIPF